MTELSILKHEINQLRAANEKEKKKRQISRKKVPNGGGLNRDEVQALLQLQNQVNEAVDNAAAQSLTKASQPRQRALPTCSNCHIQGHIRTQCPTRDPN